MGWIFFPRELDGGVTSERVVAGEGPGVSAFSAFSAESQILPSHTSAETRKYYALCTDHFSVRLRSGSPLIDEGGLAAPEGLGHCDWS